MIMRTIQQKSTPFTKRARTLPNEKVLAIFQPHLFSRTKDFADGFAASLSQFDEILLLDIYPARELPMEGLQTGWLKK
jgi:UDP-N-acetylmuramate--alanine ligase